MKRGKEEMNYMIALREFHKKYGHFIANRPIGWLPQEVYELRVRLIQEEWNELRNAMYTADKTLIADGLADLLYVVFGTALSYGIPMDEIFAEVHRSNMTKSTEKINGKTVKGDSFEPPQLESLLKQ